MIPTRILDSSLLQITIDFSGKRDYPLGKIMGYSNSSGFMTELMESKRNEPALCMTLLGDIILLPYVSNFHWSMIGVYLRERIVFHCDFKAKRDGDEKKPIFFRILQCIEWFCAHECISMNVKYFKLVPLININNSIRKRGRGNQWDFVPRSNIKLPAFTQLHLKEDEGPFAVPQWFLEHDSIYGSHSVIIN